jgi:hypothetical protein
MAERQINTQKGNSISEKYPTTTTTTKMTGEGNESAERKKEEQSSHDEEAVTKMEEDNTPVEVANTKGKGKKGKAGNKSDSSEPVDDDSEKNNIDDDVPLSFPQRVSYCMSGRISMTSALL